MELDIPLDLTIQGLKDKTFERVSESQGVDDECADHH